MRMMRDEAIARLKAHETELRDAGITSLALFGSVARGEAGEGADLDLMCEIDGRRVLGLLDFIGLQMQLEDIVGSPVDLVERPCMLPQIAARADHERMPIF